MTTLAIIGTAGRGSDILHLSKTKYETMIECARWVMDHTSTTNLVSGGAAWADHVALEIGLPLSLWLPASNSDLRTAREYHKAFSHVVGRDTWFEVTQRDYFACGSFKMRNTKVAEEASLFLAMTFGNGPILKDGGTADTVAKMQAMGKKGFHLDLWTEELYEL